MSTAIPRFLPAPVTRLLEAWRRIGECAATWARTRRHHREVVLLQTFDERMLRDIGLTRADVQAAAWTPFWRDPAAILKDRAGPRGAQISLIARRDCGARRPKGRAGCAYSVDPY